MTNKLLLYYPKEKPLSILNDISQKVTEIPVEFAFYCMCSILHNMEIIEKLIIGIEVQEKMHEKELQIIQELNQDLINLNQNILVVSTSCEPFKNFFSKQKPFYKRARSFMGLGSNRTANPLKEI